MTLNYDVTVFFNRQERQLQKNKTVGIKVPAGIGFNKI